MKKSTIALLAFFAVQIIAVICIIALPNEPVSWGQDELGEYKIASCKYGDAVLENIQSAVKEYEEKQLEAYKTDTEEQLVIVQPTRILCNKDGVTVVEYRTQRTSFSKTGDSAYFGNKYEILDTAQLWITETQNGANASMRPVDCNAKSIIFEAPSSVNS